MVNGGGTEPPDLVSQRPPLTTTRRQPRNATLAGDFTRTGVSQMDRDLPLRSSDSDESIRQDPQLIVVYDGEQECPYLDGRVARMPLEYARTALTRSDVDCLLKQGYRRTGMMFYRTRCPSCRECVPTRVDVNEFVETRSMRRVLHRSQRELKIEVATPTADATRIRLFNDHRLQRGLSRSGPASASDYREFPRRDLR